MHPPVFDSEKLWIILFYISAAESNICISVKFRTSPHKVENWIKMTRI